MNPELCTRCHAEPVVIPWHYCPKCLSEIEAEAATNRVIDDIIARFFSGACVGVRSENMPVSRPEDR